MTQASGDIAADPSIAAPTTGPSPPASRHERHFATDHLMGDLKGRSVRGGAVTLSSQAVKFVLQMGSTVVLARLLLPSDFGLIAMVTAITGFVAMFKDAGLSMATVQRKDITHDQVSTLFWINVALSAAVMLVVAALAPLIAAFYSEPRLVWVTLALAGTMLFGGFTVQHQALLRRQMRFKALAIIEIASMAGGIAVAITMALMDFGYWSLVGMTAAAAFTNAVMVWVMCDWRPGPPRHGSGAGEMLKFGGNLTGFNAINYWSRNADNMLIGWYWGSGPLGLYSKAYSLLMLPIRQINAPMSAVMIPALSRRQSQPAEYKRMYRRALSAMALAGMPLVGFCYAAAESIVGLALGPNFADAVPIFRALALAAFIGTTNVAPGWVYITLGNTHRQFRWAVFSTPVLLGLMAAALPWGPVAVAWAFSFGYLLAWIGGIMYCFRGTFMRIEDVFGAIWPVACATITAVLLVNFCLEIPSTGDLQSLLTMGFFFGSTLFVVCAAIPRLRNDIIQTVRLAKFLQTKR